MRKIILLSMVAAGLAAGLLAGCKGQGEKQRPKVLPAAKVEEYKPVPGKYGGQMVLGSISEPKSFNVITESETSTSEFTGLMYLGLTKLNAWTAEVEPELALSWTPDESGLIWTVKLRSGVQWSDGTPFTADDVLFTYQVMYDKRWQCSMRDVLVGPHGEEWKVEKIDDLTLRFTLPNRNAIFPQLIAASIIPKHKFQSIADSGKLNEAMGANVNPDELVGTGPFLLDHYEPGIKVVMKRNPHYYRLDSAGNRMPYLDNVVFLIVPNVDVLMLNFRQGQIDVAGIQGKDFPILAGPQENANYTVYKLGPTMGSEFLFFNENTGVNPKTGEPYVAPYKLKWFRDQRFRQAVSYAIDRKFIVNSILNGLGFEQYGPMIPESGLFFCNPNIPQYPLDLDKARALLKEVGLKPDKDGTLRDAEGHAVEFNLTTNVENPVRQAIAETIRKDLENLGMKVNYRPSDFNGLVTRLDSTFDWEACVLGLTAGPEPAWGANVWKSSGHTHQWFPQEPKPSTEWEAEIDHLFDQGIQELDKNKRREIYFKWQEIVGEEQPMIYTAAPMGLVAVRNKFGNIFPTPVFSVMADAAIHNIDEIYAK